MENEFDQLENTLREEYKDALHSRDFPKAKKLAAELGEQLPTEYFSIDIAEKNITPEENTIKKPYEIICITNKTSKQELEKVIAYFADQQRYNVIVIKEKLEFKPYKYRSVAPEFKDANFDSEKDAQGVKDISQSPIYYAKIIINEHTSIVLEETKEHINYHILTSSVDNDGELRAELPTKETKTIPKKECIDLLVQEGNFSRPGLLLPNKHYDWKDKIIAGYNTSK